MDDKIKTFIKVWITAFFSICYCYYIPSHISKGIRRLLSLLPIVALFTLLPVFLSAAHLCGPTAFFLVWLANSKLLLFAFGLGPLSGSKNLIQFLSKASGGFSLSSPLSLYFIYCCYIYLSTDPMVSMSSALVHAVVGLQMEPQFDELYLSTSLQDFWGHRWNLVVTGILRPTVYLPTLEYCSRILARKWSRAFAVFVSFLVSGLMHELMYYYMIRVRPTWKVTRFFVLHGSSMVAEVAAKKAVAGKWRFPVAVSRLLTLGYVMVTSVWLWTGLFPVQTCLNRCKITHNSYRS